MKKSLFKDSPMIWKRLTKSPVGKPKMRVRRFEPKRYTNTVLVVRYSKKSFKKDFAFYDPFCFSERQYLMRRIVAFFARFLGKVHEENASGRYKGRR